MTGQDVINRMVRLLKRYVVLSDAQALTCALWALNTWLYERFPAVPYLEIWAMHKRSGKTTLAEILKELSRGGSILATVRVLQMVRLIEAKEGAYVPFIEEAERFNAGSLGDQRAILATGYRKGAVHEVGDNKGGALQFRTFCPKAFVLIGNVHEILRDRCISMKLERGTPAHSWMLERTEAERECVEIIEDWKQLLKTAKTSMDVVLTADGAARFPNVDPSWLQSPRDREIWTPLFSVAAAMRLHKDSMGLLKRASMDLSYLKTLPNVKYHASQEEPVAADANAAEAIIRDAVTVMRDGEKGISSVHLLKRLHDIDEGPWRVFAGEGLNERSMAALLARWNVEPGSIRLGKGKSGDNSNVVKGYKLDDLKAGLVKSREGK